MGKIYLPYAEQFDLMNRNLEAIAGAISRDLDVSTWAGVQKAVRAGVASSLFPVGTRFTVNHSVYGNKAYDVVAHDHYKSAHGEYAHTMTLMSHDIVLGTIPYEYAEALYYAETALSVGSYRFTIPRDYWGLKSGTYYFTLTKGLPAGGVICLAKGKDVDIVTGGLVTYKDRSDTSTYETTGVSTSAISATNLGTMGQELNHVVRVCIGSDNYKESFMRQYLNSNGTMSGSWRPQTKYDVKPTGLTSLSGYFGGLDEELRDVIGEVVVPCVANESWESPDSSVKVGEKYTVKDKVFLASRTEVFGEDTRDDGSSQLAYYNDATNADRVKYLNGNAASWFLRSSDLEATLSVGSDGDKFRVGNHATAGLVPVFNIV